MQSLSGTGSDVEQLRDILGPSVARTRLRDLLQRASGSVQRAVDLHFGADDSPARHAPDLFVLDASETASGSGARQSNELVERLHRRRRDPPRAARQPGTPAWQALSDFVELSSTDNDFDPSECYSPPLPVNCASKLCWLHTGLTAVFSIARCQQLKQ